tara:strand:+ start:94 stop:318 length:225 start_codon:yes stop_codon:yes gene_type:complete
MKVVNNTIIKINIEEELLFESSRDDIDTIVQEKVLGSNNSSTYITWEPVSEYALEKIDDEQYLVFEINYVQEEM